MSAVNKSCGCGCGSSACGCCSGVEPLTPMPTANRAGLSSISYRVGTHSTFLDSMKARLSLHQMPDGQRPLAALSTRESSDPSVALLDAWATVADVLTFYQERIANEGYIRTALEMRSVYELARLVGYRPRPGVASSVYLAYTIDPNTKEEVIIPKGARAQSVPGPGELPQSFETSEPLNARASWNELKVRLNQPQQLQTILSKNRVYFGGVTTGLVPNDLLLAKERGSQPQLLRVLEVLPDAKNDRTLIKVEPWQTAGQLQFAARARLEELLDTAPEGATATAIREDVRKLLANAAAGWRRLASPSGRRQSRRRHRAARWRTAWPHAEARAVGRRGGKDVIGDGSGRSATSSTAGRDSAGDQCVGVASGAAGVEAVGECAPAAARADHEFRRKRRRESAARRCGRAGIARDPGAGDCGAGRCPLRQGARGVCVSGARGGVWAQYPEAHEARARLRRQRR
jgi:hypothetical protein